MALRSPIYLDTETLLAQAEYHDIDVPRQADIVEKTVRRRSGGGKVGVSGLGVDASAGTDIEYQSTYSLKPKEKATASKVIDSLIIAEAVKINPDGETVLGRDDLIEIQGTTRITAASLAGKTQDLGGVRDRNHWPIQVRRGYCFPQSFSISNQGVIFCFDFRIGSRVGLGGRPGDGSSPSGSVSHRGVIHCFDFRTGNRDGHGGGRRKTSDPVVQKRQPRLQVRQYWCVDRRTEI